MSARGWLLPLAVALLCVALTSLLQQALATRTEAERQASEQRQLLDLLPPRSYDNQPLQRPLSVPGQATPAYRASLDGRLTAVLLMQDTQGYEGPIRLLVAIAPDGRLIGCKVLAQRETPSLGDAIVRPQWLAQFHAATPNSRWQWRMEGGDFDQIAGATLSSRAVLLGVQRALLVFAANRERLLEATP